MQNQYGGNKGRKNHNNRASHDRDRAPVSFRDGQPVYAQRKSGEFDRQQTEPYGRGKDAQTYGKKPYERGAGNKDWDHAKKTYQPGTGNKDWNNAKKPGPSAGPGSCLRRLSKLSYPLSAHAPHGLLLCRRPRVYRDGMRRLCHPIFFCASAALARLLGILMV